MRNNKTIILLVIALLILLGSLLVTPISRINKAKVEVIVGPSTATVEVDGKKISDGSVYVSKTSHTFTATLEGFSAAKKTLDVKTDTKVRLLLNPITDAAKQLLDDHPNLQLDRERIGSSEFGETSAKIEQKYPYLSQLPLSGGRFSISYGMAQQTKNNNDRQAIALYINAPDPDERRNAIKNLSSELNVDPSTIEIVFEDYTNPFLSEERLHND